MKIIDLKPNTIIDLIHYSIDDLEAWANLALNDTKYLEDNKLCLTTHYDKRVLFLRNYRESNGVIYSMVRTATCDKLHCLVIAETYFEVNVLQTMKYLKTGEI
jgi:hypothetical protein